MINIKAAGVKELGPQAKGKMKNAPIPHNNRSKVKRKAKIRNRYNQIPHLTRDTIWESDKTKETQNSK